MKFLTTQFAYNKLYEERTPVKCFYSNGTFFQMFIDENPDDMYKHVFLKEKPIDKQYKDFLVFC